MKEKTTVQLSNGRNDVIEIPLRVDGDWEVATILIDGVLYHFERIRKETLLSPYRADNDPPAKQAPDPDGYRYILTPYCE
jgi:hypothetical protein